MALVVFALPICASTVTYYIDITPKADNDAYQMNLNDTTVFAVKGYKNDGKSEVPEQVKITKVWWEFDKDILAKTGATPNSITLKANKTGTSKLTVRTMLENSNCIKTITVMVREPLRPKRPKKR